MDVVVWGVIGALTVALLAAGVLDVVRGARRRRHRLADDIVDVRAEPRHLVLVRHGQTEWSETGQHTSRTDIPLTEEGRRQAEAIREQLDGWVFDAVFVSPMARARDTLERLARAEPVRVLDDLREWDYGRDEGMTTVEIRRARPGWVVWDGPAGGETIDQVAARARRVIHEADGDVLIVGHGHLLRVLAACWLGLDPRDGRFLALDPASISVLGHERDQRVLERWNLSPPAPADGER